MEISSNAHSPPETTHLIMPNMNINHNGHRKLQGNLSIHTSAWDIILPHDIRALHFQRCYHIRLLTTCVSTQQQNKFLHETMATASSATMINHFVVHYETSVLHKSLMWVHSINTHKCSSGSLRSVNTNITLVWSVREFVAGGVNIRRGNITNIRRRSNSSAT